MNMNFHFETQTDKNEQYSVDNLIAFDEIKKFYCPSKMPLYIQKNVVSLQFRHGHEAHARF